MGNPKDHVINYKAFMELQTHLDALLCKVFPTTLARAVQSWFHSPEVEIIKSFLELAKTYIRSFITCMPTTRKTSFLENIKQMKGEILREYMARFITKALQIPYLDETWAMEAMQKRTTSIRFFKSLSRKLLITLTELTKGQKMEHKDVEKKNDHNHPINDKSSKTILMIVGGSSSECLKKK
ncbi:hypothetical protein P3X46_002434 [Hevea brasiliensis]|uniref:Retrotransposon gag domain-containing protein n=1 Tax=Hevea brasiliensis TaxID=3981 RepID=A0ABQ9N2Y8_HEVBR|nr:hypothetical protein P3X46_002434 [Hevea brasiliensis]